MKILRQTTHQWATIASPAVAPFFNDRIDNAFRFDVGNVIISPSFFYTPLLYTLITLATPVLQTSQNIW